MQTVQIRENVFFVYYFVLINYLKITNGQNIEKGQIFNRWN